MICIVQTFEICFGFMFPLNFDFDFLLLVEWAHLFVEINDKSAKIFMCFNFCFFFLFHTLFPWIWLVSSTFPFKNINTLYNFLFFFSSSLVARCLNVVVIETSDGHVLNCYLYVFFFKKMFRLFKNSEKTE